jgi:uncharacterized protein YjiS (DUF1127 family)
MMSVTEGAQRPGRTGHDAPVWWTRLQAALGRIAAFGAARRQRARDFQTLSDFTDRQLWDIGLSRSDVQGAIKGTYRRD